MTPEETRAMLAGRALQGMLASNGADWDIGPDKTFTVVECVQYADALMKALEMPVGKARWQDFPT